MKKCVIAVALMAVLLAVGAAYGDHVEKYPCVSSDTPPASQGATRNRPMVYRIDDVYGNSGSRGQWVAILKSADIYEDFRTVGGTSGDFTRYETRGGRMDRLPIIAGANIINERNNVYLYNGFYEPRVTSPDFVVFYEQSDPKHPYSYKEGQIPHMPIRQIFMVIPNNQAATSIDFYLRKDQDKDATHIGSTSQPWTLDMTVGYDGYRTIKDAKGQFSTNPQANRYVFDLFKETDADKYSTIRTYYTFHQNPSETPSQTINIPLIIANVAMGSATEKELEFTTVIREVPSSVDMHSTGQLIASHNFTWDAHSDKRISSTDGDDWIFVPQNNPDRLDKNIDTKYQVTIDVKNYCGLRYALQRYDLMNNAGENYEKKNINPNSWRFDLPYTVTDIDRDIYLDKLSHIAPGLVTRYIQTYNIRTLNQRLMRIYPADTVHDNSSPRDLILTHNRVGGVILGSKGVNATYNEWNRRHSEVRAFYYLHQDVDFLKNADTQKLLHLYREGEKAVVNATAGMPKPGRAINMADGVDTSAFVTDAAVGTVKFNVTIPDDLKYVSDDPARHQVTLLPVIITFNVPADDPYMTRDDVWNKMLEKWRADGNIKDLFRQYFHIYSRLEESANVNDNSHRNFDISEFLSRNSSFNDNVKVMLDEQNKCLTVTFMAMLVDSNLADYSMLTDSLDVSYSALRGIGTRKFLAILDGNRNDRWDLTLYVRRVNIGVGDAIDPNRPGITTSGGGGGGCTTGVGILSVAAIVCFALRRKDR